MQKRRQRLELAHERARSHPHALHALHAPRGYSIAEEKGGRMRRPTAIMRSNVEVARLMAVPGSKQRQLSQDEYGYGEEAPMIRMVVLPFSNLFLRNLASFPSAALIWIPKVSYCSPMMEI